MKKYRLSAILLIAFAFMLSSFGVIADADTGFKATATASNAAQTAASVDLKLTDNVSLSAAGAAMPMRVAGNGLPGNSGECFDTDIVTCNSDSLGGGATQLPWWPPTPVPAGASCNSCHAPDNLRPD